MLTMVVAITLRSRESLINIVFSVIASMRRAVFRDAAKSAGFHADLRPGGLVLAPFRAVVRAQGALIPQRLIAMRRFFASTRLARPNRLYSCASFLASPRYRVFL